MYYLYNIILYNLSQKCFSATMLSCLDLKLEVDYYSIIINTGGCKKTNEKYGHQLGYQLQIY